VDRPKGWSTIKQAPESKKIDKILSPIDVKGLFGKGFSLYLTISITNKMLLKVSSILCIDCYSITEKTTSSDLFVFFYALIFCTEFTKFVHLKDVVKDNDMTKNYWSARKREFKQAHPNIHLQIQILQEGFKHFLSGLGIVDSIRSTSSKVLFRKLAAILTMTSNKSGSDQFNSIRETEMLGQKSLRATELLGGTTLTSDQNQSQQMDGLLAIAFASLPGPVANAAGVDRALKSPVASKIVGTRKKPPPPPFPPPNASANAAGIERAWKSPVASKLVGTPNRPPPPTFPPPNASANAAGVKRARKFPVASKLVRTPNSITASASTSKCQCECCRCRGKWSTEFALSYHDYYRIQKQETRIGYRCTT
jgi:hypothetical protein